MTNRIARLAALLAASALIACTAESADKSAASCRAAADPADPAGWFDLPRPACYSELGHGLFGEWDYFRLGEGEQALPAYRYLIDETSDPAAQTPVTYDEGTSTDQWHMFGNERAAAAAHNGGYIELFSSERGIIYLNRFEDELGNRAAGYMRVTVDAGETFTTLSPAFGGVPPAERVFLPWGYRQKHCAAGVCVVRTSFFPEGGELGGDASTMMNLIEVSSDDGAAHEVVVEEPFHLNVIQAKAASAFGGDARNSTFASRKGLNRDFNLRLDSFEGGDLLGAVFTNITDAELDLYGYSSNRLPEVYVAWLAPQGDGEETVYEGSAFEHGQVMQLTRTVSVASGSPAQVTSLYGWASTAGTDINGQLAELRSQSGADWLNSTEAWYEAMMPDLRLPAHPELEREIGWHAAQLRALGVYEEAFEAHTINQGSAYGFLQGANGAPRDFGFSGVAALYTQPRVAREILRFIARMQQLPDMQIGYSTTGFGIIEGVVIHEHPSDLDLFFLWLASEYLLATRDYDFLDTVEPFYPPAGSAAVTMLDHVTISLNHLHTAVGYGSHGLIKLIDGDWSDGIILRADDAGRARETGESTYNAAMAAYVMPRLAAALAPVDEIASNLATEIGESQTAAMQDTWTGDWFLRGYADPDTPLGEDQLFVEPQVWALLAGIPDEPQTDTLVGNIKTILDDPSPVGAVIVYPPSEQGSELLIPGWDVNGGVWFAMNGLLTWAYGLTDPARSLEHQLRFGLTGHAQAYPEIWYGIWSGPDSYNAWYAESPGYTFEHLATAMLDFPVGNSNAHAMPLLSAIRGAGILPSADGWDFIPLWSERPLMLRLPTVGIAYSEQAAAGYIDYQALGTPADTALTVRVALPAGAAGAVTVNGAPADSTTEAGVVRFTVVAGSDGAARFEVR